jgi:hypothetical protein
MHSNGSCCKTPAALHNFTLLRWVAAAAVVAAAAAALAAALLLRSLVSLAEGLLFSRRSVGLLRTIRH